MISKAQFLGALSESQISAAGTGEVFPIAGETRAGGGKFPFSFSDNIYQSKPVSEAAALILADNPAYKYAACIYSNGDNTLLYIKLYTNISLPPNTVLTKLDKFPSDGINKDQYVTCKGDNTNSICTASTVTNKGKWAIYRRNLTNVSVEYLNPSGAVVLKADYDFSLYPNGGNMAAVFGGWSNSLPHRGEFDSAVRQNANVKSVADINLLLNPPNPPNPSNDCFPNCFPNTLLSGKYGLELYVNGNRTFNRNPNWDVNYVPLYLLNTTTGIDYNTTYNELNFPFKVSKFQYSVINDSGKVKTGTMSGETSEYIIFKLNIVLDAVVSPQVLTTCDPKTGTQIKSWSVSDNFNKVNVSITGINCPIDCVMSGWSLTKPCNIFSGKGEEKRTVLIEPKNGGSGCSTLKVREIKCTPVGLYGLALLILLVIIGGGVFFFRRKSK